MGLTTIAKTCHSGAASPHPARPPATAELQVPDPAGKAPPASRPPSAAKIDRGFQVHEFICFDACLLAFEGLVYFAALALPAQALWMLKDRSPLLLVGAAICAFPAAAFAFVLLLIVARRLVLPSARIPAGRLFRRDPKALRWLVAGLLQEIFWRSPFWRFVNSNWTFRQLFYRGMGARIDGTFLMESSVKLADPWSFQAGRGVLLGEGAIVAGHKIEREVVTLGPVEIGDHVLIGARTILFPNVKIGAGAVVGAHSVVVRGTVIPPGETWSGNPAVKSDPFRRAAT